MEDQTFHNVATKLRKVILGDSQILEEIYQKLKYITDNSQLLRQDGTDVAVLLSSYEDQMSQIEHKLINTCLETGDVKNMRWFYFQARKDVGFYCIKHTTNSAHDPYVGAVIDLMSLYEQNCRKKEELENMLNKVHKKLIKYKARQSSTRLEDSLPYIPEDRYNTAYAAAGSQENEQKNFQQAERTCHLQPSVTSRRKPLAPLNLNQCREIYSAENQKKDPLTRVRSPVLSAYLQKLKD